MRASFQRSMEERSSLFLFKFLETWVSLSTPRSREMVIKAESGVSLSGREGWIHGFCALLVSYLAMPLTSS